MERREGGVEGGGKEREQGGRRREVGERGEGEVREREEKARCVCSFCSLSLSPMDIGSHIVNFTAFG